MADEERIGASFYIDATQLKAGIRTANKLIKESESEFKKAAAGMDDWTKSEDGLNAKIKSLNQIADVQRKKVDSLKDEYKRLVDEGLDETSDRAIALRTQINKEEAALAANEKEIRQQTDALERLKNGEDAAAEAMDVLTKKSDKATGGFTIMKGALSNLAASGFKAVINGATKLASALFDVGEKADDLNTLSQQSGFSTTELQKFQYAADLIDVSVEDIVGSAKKLKKNMVSNSKDTAGAFETLGVSVKDAVTGELRNSTEVFYDVVQALSTVENETKRDTLAMQLLGKNADTLAGIIDDGGKALEEYGKEAEDLGIILSEDAVDGANKFNDAVDKMKGTAKGAFYIIGAEIAKQLTPEIETAREKIQKFVKGANFKEFSKKAVQSIKDVINILVQIGKTVLPVASKAVSFVSKNFKTLATVVLTAVTAFKAFKAVMAVTTAITAAKTAVAGLSAGVGIATKAQYAWNAAMSANPIGAVITAVALLVGGIAMLVSSLNKSSGSIEYWNKTQREAYNRAKEVTDAFMEQRAETDKLAEANTASVDYLRDSLLPELDNLVGANYEVKASDQARVDFILGELKKALGEEYGDLQKIIDKNGEVRDSIYQTIDAKKAQILLSTYEEDYAAALKGVSAAQTEAAEAAQKLAHWQDYLDNGYGDEDARKTAREEYAAALEIYTEAASKAAEYERIIGDYEAASAAALEGNTQKVLDIFDTYATGFAKAASIADKSYQEQIYILSQQIVDTQIAYETMVDKHEKAWNMMTEEEQAAAKKAEEEAKKRADNAIEEWERFAASIPEGIAIGIDAGTPAVDAAMRRLIDSAINAAKRAADIHSPSRKFRKIIGLRIGEGTALGIKDSTGEVVTAVKNQIRAIEKAYSFGDLAFAASAEVNGAGVAGGGVNNSRTVTVVQNNTFAAAHTRYEMYKAKQQTAAAVRLALEV